jgi:GT2 family glycosyltransferase
MISRAFFNRLEGYDEWYKSHYEDVDLSLRARAAGGECWYIYKSRMHHKISVTYKKYVTRDALLFDIRKNRLMTVLKNFRGIDKVVRLGALAPVFIATAVTDIMSFDRKMFFLTIRAVIAASIRRIV